MVSETNVTKILLLQQKFHFRKPSVAIAPAWKRGSFAASARLSKRFARVFLGSRAIVWHRTDPPWPRGAVKFVT
jgi:hypothetical protein